MKRNRTLNEEKREAILKASIDEFYKKGYEASSMDIIAKEANVSKATVYNHFNNKEELFFAITNILKERFENSFGYEYLENKPIEKQLYEMAKKEMDFLSCKENITLIQIVTVVMIQKNEIGLKLLEAFKEKNTLTISKWFTKAKEDGKLNFEDEEFVAKQFIANLKAFAFYPQLYGEKILTKQEQKKVIENCVNLVMKLYGVKNNTF